MTKRSQLPAVVWCCLLFPVIHSGLTNIAASAPPELTALYPAGGTQGQEVRVTLQGKVDLETAQMWADRPGIEVLGADGKDAVKIKLADDVVPGLAWLAWHNTEGLSVQRPFVISTLPELLEVEPNNAPKLSDASLTLPVVMNGVLQKSGDVDAFAVDLKSSETLVAQMEALGALGSPMDGLVQVADSRGFVLLQNDDTRGFDPRLAFTAPHDDRYYVRVFAFPSAPDSSIRFAGGANYIYRITLTLGPAITRWQPPAVTAGAPATSVGMGWNIAPEGISHDFTPAKVGFSFPMRTDAVTLATLQVTPFPVIAAEAANSVESPQIVAWPVCVTGKLHGRKSAQGWKISATKGQKLHLQVATAALGSPLDAVLRVFDTGGKKLLEVDDAARDDFEIDSEFSIPADGDYVLAVSERFWHGGPDYVYTLTVSPAAKDLALTVAGNSFTLKADSPLEIPVTVERRYGMAEAITISAEDLPEGVTADPVTSEPKGDSSKSVKLVLKSTRDAEWIGPLRVLGKSAEPEGPTGVASVAREVRRSMAPQVLLKVLAKAP